jgi:His-Xaa-Ser system radical SAM maturase HxsB
MLGDVLTKIRTPSTSFAAPFRFREVAGRVVVTGHSGQYVVLSPDEFQSFANGDVDRASELFGRLRDADLIAGELDTARVAERIRERKTFTHYGPNLHIAVVTLRCNETCVYCHASRRPMDATETDMTPETAEKVVDLALRSTNPSVTLEFQGGEPLVNFPVMQHMVDYALERNAELGKRLEFTMVSNLSLMDEEKLAWLLEKRVQVCTSVDGPVHLHDKQRVLPGSSAYDSTAKWIRRINQAYIDEGLNPEVYHVEALLTTTRETLKQWREVVDTYVDLGCRALFLRPVDPFGFMARTGERVAYPTEEYMAFYRQAVDYMIELNRDGVQILERYASIFLTKILAGQDPNFLDIRNPCGAGIGQVAYNYDGKIFTCDEGRMLHEEGDDTFLIGDVEGSSYRELMGHETVRAMAIASNLDAQPDCVNCAYNPYCGVCPVVNHKTQGGLFGRMRDSAWCAVHKGIQDYLFEKIGDGGEVMNAFSKWITVRDRGHYVHGQ